MQQQIGSYSLKPSWVTAVDGLTLDPNPSLRKLFKDNDFGNRRGIIGCALSHYNLWQELLVDPVHDYYVVLEDDVTLCDNFKEKLDDVLNKIEELTTTQ